MVHLSWHRVNLLEAYWTGGALKDRLVSGEGSGMWPGGMVYGFVTSAGLKLRPGAEAD